MRHSNDATRETMRTVNASGEACYASGLVASGTWTPEFALSALSAAGGCWIVDVPTYSRRRSESPVIPGSMFWR